MSIGVGSFSFFKSRLRLGLLAALVGTSELRPFSVQTKSVKEDADEIVLIAFVTLRWELEHWIVKTIRL